MLYPSFGAFPRRDFFVSWAFFRTSNMVGFTLWGWGLLCTHDVNRWEFLCEIKLFGLVRWAAKKRTRITNKLLIRWNASCGDGSIDDENRHRKRLKVYRIKGFRGLPPKTGGSPESLSNFFTIYPIHRNCQNARLRVRYLLGEATG